MRECEDRSSDFSAVNSSSAVSRDLVAIITALEYNQWFTKVSIKDYKLVKSIKLQPQNNISMETYNLHYGPDVL